MQDSVVVDTVHIATSTATNWPDAAMFIAAMAFLAVAVWALFGGPLIVKVKGE